MIDWNRRAPIQEISHTLLKKKEINLSLLREDLLHPSISGNKFRKLRYYLEALRKSNKSGFLSFGGPFSNHIHALARLCKIYEIPCTAYIRGLEWQEKWRESPTLLEVASLGAQLCFVSRKEYNKKYDESYLIKLNELHPDLLIVPEGGHSTIGFRGTQEILGKHTLPFDYLTVAVGTGTTLSGLLKSKKNHQKCMGFLASKEDKEYRKDKISANVSVSGLGLISNYHFGGFGRVNDELIRFMNSFFQEQKIPLDPIYTGKMIHGIFDLIENDYFPKHSRILALHTGGLQGARGTNAMRKRKGLITLDYIK